MNLSPPHHSSVAEKIPPSLYFLEELTEMEVEVTETRSPPRVTGREKGMGEVKRARSVIFLS